eukprot:scaffold18072_cov73-Isochrysis_galbana.AAC.1
MTLDKHDQEEKAKGAQPCLACPPVPWPRSRRSAPSLPATAPASRLCLLMQHDPVDHQNSSPWWTTKIARPGGPPK